jgi:hypothetical protein
VRRLRNVLKLTRANGGRTSFRTPRSDFDFDGGVGGRLSDCLRSLCMIAVVVVVVVIVVVVGKVVLVTADKAGVRDVDEWRRSFG